MQSFSSRDGTQLHERRWAPDPAGSSSVKGTVIIVHGYGEHIARYDHLAAALVRAGYVVHGCDLRGHGLSKGPRGHIMRWDEYLGDVEALVGRAAGDPRPHFLFGHSMGGLVATHYALAHADQFAGLVLSSPYFKLKLAVPPLKIAAGRFFSKWVPALGLPSGLKGSDVSRDPEIARVYDNDPLNNKKATARWFTEATTAQEQALARAGELTLPALVLHGGGDKIADPAGTEAVFHKLSSPDKTLEIYPGQYHELFNEVEPDRAGTIAELVRWLDLHAAG